MTGREPGALATVRVGEQRVCWTLYFVILYLAVVLVLVKLTAGRKLAFHGFLTRMCLTALKESEAQKWPRQAGRLQRQEAPA